MKQKILALLSHADAIVSGEQLSRQLGISRVAVWKHVRGLQQAGCAIATTTRGYRLKKSSDTPFPWNLGAWSNRVHYFPQLTSTMDTALEMAHQGAGHFSVVVADSQTNGRGRMQRAWQSATGGLYFTVVLRPAVPPAQAPLINLAAAVDLSRVLINRYGIDARVKWPNDVLVTGRKLAGILSIMEAETDRIHFVTLGIGINVNSTPAIDNQPVTSVSQITGRPVSRSRLLAAFLDAFNPRMQYLRPPEVIEQWRELSATLGQQVSIQTFADRVRGLAVDIEADGALVLETADGERRTIHYGDCVHGHMDRIE